MRLTVNGKTRDAAAHDSAGSGDQDGRRRSRRLRAGAGPRARRHERRRVDMINRLEMMRKQIARSSARRTPRQPDVARALAESRQEDVRRSSCSSLSRSDMNSDDKYYVEPYKVYMNLIWLNGVVGNGAGDVAGGADYRADGVGARRGSATSRRISTRRSPPTSRSSTPMSPRSTRPCRARFQPLPRRFGQWCHEPALICPARVLRLHGRAAGENRHKRAERTQTVKALGSVTSRNA